MRTLLAASLTALILAGCSPDDEDFTVTIDRPATEVMTAFSQVDISKGKLIFPEIDMKASRIGTDRIVYNFPGSGIIPGQNEAVVNLRFEPSPDSAKTIVHAQVTVPETKVKLNGKDMVYSEDKVEDKIRKAIRTSGAELEKGETGAEAIAAFSEAITGVAVGSNQALAARLADDGAISPIPRSARFDDPDRPREEPEAASYGSRYGSSRPEKFGEVRTDQNGFRFGDPTAKQFH